jgi:hypothetical protein
MLQDDGSIECYCITNNHRRLLLNLPELIAHMYKSEQENSIESYKDGIPVSESNTTSELQAETAANDPADLNGTLTPIDVQNLRGTLPG